MILIPEYPAYFGKELGFRIVLLILFDILECLVVFHKMMVMCIIPAPVRRRLGGCLLGVLPPARCRSGAGGRGG